MQVMSRNFRHWGGFRGAVVHALFLYTVYFKRCICSDPDTILAATCALEYISSLGIQSTRVAVSQRVYPEVSTHIINRKEKQLDFR